MSAVHGVPRTRCSGERGLIVGVSQQRAMGEARVLRGQAGVLRGEGRVLRSEASRMG